MNEIRSLELTRDSLQASIKARKETGNTDAGFVSVTSAEEGRLREVETRLAELNAAREATDA